ncbi:hypothetical protein [uncultured Roseibium sp.]|uniref:hypothetical protein n=1 Tax=uncultured Roseibium sp. TaxID=1936171 RepID=UPI00260367E7|nr:hypothetical protein [uncultured Roseibium sp.]
MKAKIISFFGFESHPETDHAEMDMRRIIGVAHYEVEYPDGSTEAIFTGLRPGENNAWNLEVIKAAQVWRSAGGVIGAWVPPTAEEIREGMQPLSARQFRLGLLDAGGTFAQVEAAIATIEDETERAKAQIEWEYAATFNRMHPLVVNLSVSLGFKPEDIDVLWARALQL